MPAIIKNIVAVICGIVVGGVVNMTLVSIGPSLIPLPEGADISTTEGLRDSMTLFAPANFLFPFLGHALGTLSGAFVAAKLAAKRPLILAFVIGAFFLAGGISMVLLVGGPLWFQVVDIVVAYVPMGYLGGRLAVKQPRNNNN